MKKFFAFVAAALVAFSFASCEGGSSKGFKIAVSDIEATTAVVAVVPSDTTAYYYLAVYDNSIFEEHKYEDAFEYFQERMKYYVETYQVDIATLAQYGYVEQGSVEYEYTGLSPETEYIVLVAQIDDQFNMVGEFATKTFKTTEIHVEKTENIAIEGAKLTDKCADQGWWQLQAYTADSMMYFTFSPMEANELAGTYTLDDMDEDYTLIYDAAAQSEYAFVTLNITTAVENNIFKLTGKGLATNAVEYNFNITAPVAAEGGDASAPKKVIAVKNANTLQAAKHVAVKSLKK